MTRFLNTDKGEINLAHVATARRCSPKSEVSRTTLSLFDAEKRLLDEIEFLDAIDLEEITAPVVPAAPGSVAAVLHTMTSDERIGSCPDEIYAEQLPIVGWRVLPERAVPVLPEERTRSSTILLLMPDGRWLEPGSSSFANLEEAKTATLKQAQADWRRQHASDKVVKPREVML